MNGPGSSGLRRGLGGMPVVALGDADFIGNTSSARYSVRTFLTGGELDPRPGVHLGACCGAWAIA